MYYAGGFVSIGFPDAGCKKWLDHVDLYEIQDILELKENNTIDLQDAIQRPTPRLKPKRNISGA